MDLQKKEKKKKKKILHKIQKQQTWYFGCKDAKQYVIRDAEMLLGCHL